MKALSGKLRLLAAAGGLACAAVLVTAPQASAVAWEKTMHTDDGDPGGLIRFSANGDYVEVCDIEADGYAVRGDVNDYAGADYTLTAGGNGKCSVTSAAHTGRDLLEGACVKFTVGLYKDGGSNEYEDWSFWHNSSPAYDC